MGFNCAVLSLSCNATRTAQIGHEGWEEERASKAWARE